MIKKTIDWLTLRVLSFYHHLHFTVPKISFENFPRIVLLFATGQLVNLLIDSYWFNTPMSSFKIVFVFQSRAVTVKKRTNFKCSLWAQAIGWIGFRYINALNRSFMGHSWCCFWLHRRFEENLKMLIRPQKNRSFRRNDFQDESSLTSKVCLLFHKMKLKFHNTDFSIPFHSISFFFVD